MPQFRIYRVADYNIFVNIPYFVSNTHVSATSLFASNTVYLSCIDLMPVSCSINSGVLYKNGYIANVTVPLDARGIEGDMTSPSQKA